MRLLRIGLSLTLFFKFGFLWILLTIIRDLSRKFAFIATHLTRLTQKMYHLFGSTYLKIDFKILSFVFTIAPILALPVKGKDFIVFYNISQSRLGVVLMQNRNVIVFVSKKLKLYERNYRTHDFKLTTVFLHLKYGDTK